MFVFFVERYTETFDTIPVRYPTVIDTYEPGASVVEGNKTGARENGTIASNKQTKLPDTQYRQVILCVDD